MRALALLMVCLMAGCVAALGSLHALSLLALSLASSVALAYMAVRR